MHDGRYNVDQLGLWNTSNSSWLARYDYTPDVGGNITAIDDMLDGSWNRNFGYDDLGRLTTANGGTPLWGSGTYGYDAMGNLTTGPLGVAPSVLVAFA